MSSVAETIRAAGGVFVTGTDTEVGKTVAAACLVRALDGEYWKPVQAGIADGTDTETVRRLTGLDGARLHASTYELNAPLSPHQAARLDAVTIRMAAFTRPAAGRPVVVEGAGGVLVPLNDTALMIDLMEQLGLPVILVARSTLGTINHSLLSLQALRRRRLAVLGVIINGPPNPANQQAVAAFGRVTVLAALPILDPLDQAAVAGAGAALADALAGTEAQDQAEAEAEAEA